MESPGTAAEKISPGCQNCYVYRIDAQHGRDASQIFKTSDFTLPMRHARGGGFKIPPGGNGIYLFSSDFFLPEADPWRLDAWQMIQYRHDLSFYIVTKRPERILDSLPDTWGDGWENVTVCCTVENQAMADQRLPIFQKLPIRRKEIICRTNPRRNPLTKIFGTMGIAGNSWRRVRTQCTPL